MAASGSSGAEDAVYRARVLPGGRIGRQFLRMWLAGMAGLLLGLLLSFGNPFGGMIGLVAPMFWLSARMTRRAEYGVSAAGVRETLLDKHDHPLAGGERRYSWPEVASWIVDADQVRGLGERRYLELRMRDGYRMRFREADRAGEDASFSAIASALEAYATGTAALPAAAPPAPAPLPAQRPSFYARPAARLLALVFIALTLGLAAFFVAAPQYLSATAAYRIGVVLIPGTLYIAWRAFGRRPR